MVRSRSTGAALAVALLAVACGAAPPRAAAAPATRAAPAPSSLAPGDSVTSHERTSREVLPGVYVIRHEDAPDTFPQGNTTVIVGDRDVLVVDSCYLPSSAKKDIAQIRAWTRKPVRYLLNTHWHYDHTMGNAAYKDAFPEVTIVAHVETRKNIAGYNPQWFSKFPDRVKLFEARIAAGKDEGGKPYSPGELAELRTALAGTEPVWSELRAIAGREDLAPTLSFEREIDVDLGGREVRLLHLGRGNTAGDAVAFLPKERLVVTGDLLDHPVPYLGGGYPVELVATLEALTRLEPAVLVPGHGKVLHGKEYLEQVVAFLREVVGAVDREIHRAGNGSRSLSVVRGAVESSVDVAAWRQRFAGDDRENRDFFDDFSFSGLVTATHAEMWPR